MKKKSLTTLTTISSIFEALGGLRGVAELTGAGVKAVQNWFGRFEAFPSSTYRLMIDELERRGYTASPAFWKMRGWDTKRKTKRAA